MVSSPPHSPLLPPRLVEPLVLSRDTPECKARPPRTSSPLVSASSRTTSPRMQCGHPPPSTQTRKKRDSQGARPGEVTPSLPRSSGSPSEPAWLERSRQYHRCSPSPSEAPSRTDRIGLANLGSRSPSLRPVNTSPRAMASRPGQKMCKAEGKEVSFFPTVGKGRDACA